MAKRWIYHYAGQQQAGSTVVYFDGVARVASPIVDLQQYRYLKALVAGDTDELVPTQMIFTSLSLLGTDEDG